jgi:hypothetical protein
MAHPKPLEAFAALVAALGTKLQASLDADEGTVVLVDEQQALKLVVELSTAQDRVFVIRPFLPIPPDAAEAGALAGRLLAINADRTALAGACICADRVRGAFCLISELSLEMDPAAFVPAIEERIKIAELVRSAAAGEDALITGEAWSGISPIRI